MNKLYIVILVLSLLASLVDSRFIGYNKSVSGFYDHATGRIVVSSMMNVMYILDGDIISGIYNSPGSVDGALGESKITSGKGIVKYADGYLLASYIACLKFMNTSGTKNTTSVLGLCYTTGDLIGIGTAARMTEPIGIIPFDSKEDSFLLADRTNDKIYLINTPSFTSRVYASMNRPDGFAVFDGKVFVGYDTYKIGLVRYGSIRAVRNFTEMVTAIKAYGSYLFVATKLSLFTMDSNTYAVTNISSVFVAETISFITDIVLLPNGTLYIFQYNIDVPVIAVDTIYTYTYRDHYPNVSESKSSTNTLVQSRSDTPASRTVDRSQSDTPASRTLDQSDTPASRTLDQSDTPASRTLDQSDTPASRTATRIATWSDTPASRTLDKSDTPASRTATRIATWSDTPRRRMKTRSLIPAMIIEAKSEHRIQITVAGSLGLVGGSSGVSVLITSIVLGGSCGQKRNVSYAENPIPMLPAPVTQLIMFVSVSVVWLFVTWLLARFDKIELPEGKNLIEKLVLKSKLGAVIYMLMSFFAPTMILTFFQESVGFIVMNALLFVTPLIALVYFSFDALSVSVDTSSMSMTEKFFMDHTEWETNAFMYEIMMSFNRRAGFYLELTYTLIMSACTVIEDCNSLSILCVVMNGVYLLICLKFSLLQPRSSLVGLSISILTQNTAIIMVILGADPELAFIIVFIGVMIGIVLEISTQIYQYRMEKKTPDQPLLKEEAFIIELDDLL